MSKPEIITVTIRNYIDPLTVSVRDYINIEVYTKS
jgi:hypothetical protein